MSKKETQAKLCEESHKDWLQLQVDLSESMGEPPCIVKHMNVAGT